MRIKRWIRDGGSCESNGFNSDGITTDNQLLDVAGRLLDKACSHDIVGQCIFVGENGRTYVGNVEFTVSEINPDYLREVLKEEEDV